MTSTSSFVRVSTPPKEGRIVDDDEHQANDQCGNDEYEDPAEQSTAVLGRAVGELDDMCLPKAPDVRMDGSPMAPPRQPQHPHDDEEGWPSGRSRAMSGEEHYGRRIAHDDHAAAWLPSSAQRGSNARPSVKAALDLPVFHPQHTSQTQSVMSGRFASNTQTQLSIEASSPPPATAVARRPSLSSPHSPTTTNAHALSRASSFQIGHSVIAPVGRALGSGSWGDVMEGVDKASGARVAIKSCRQGAHAAKLLRDEYLVLLALQTFRGRDVPKLDVDLHYRWAHNSGSSPNHAPTASQVLFPTPSGTLSGHTPGRTSQSPGGRGQPGPSLPLPHTASSGHLMAGHPNPLSPARFGNSTQGSGGLLAAPQTPLLPSSAAATSQEIKFMPQFANSYVQEDEPINESSVAVIGLSALSPDHSISPAVQKRIDSPGYFVRGKEVVVGVPRLFGFDGDMTAGSATLVMEMLGPSMDELRDYCYGSFSPHTILMLADQAVGRIDHIHRAGLLHRDIKPDNFLMGVNENSRILYLVDFGLACFYVEGLDRKMPLPQMTAEEIAALPHVKPQANVGAVGTMKFASADANEGFQQSRRDDLIAIAYTLIFLAVGELPWGSAAMEKEIDSRNADIFGQLAPEDRKEARLQDMIRMKRALTTEELCRDCPYLINFVNHIRCLSFEERPAYGRLRAILRAEMVRLGFKYDWTQYDWLKKRSDEHRTRVELPRAD